MLAKNLLLIFILCFSACEAQVLEKSKKVRVGAEILIENHLEELNGKRVGLVMNPTARIGDTHVLDTLLTLGVNVTSLFAPEHGFRGDMGAGELIENGVDQATKLPVYSLYGSSKKPTEEMLEDIDMLIFDMQDVGARFYTYNTTMKYILEAGAQFNKEIWILDRPNPASGNYVSGWVLEEEFKSFVGSYPIPVAHGLTLGELAKMAIGEGWVNTKETPKVKVIEMVGWERSMDWVETGISWVPPSPNLPTFEHAFVYLGTCFFEGTTLSEGRGTDNPFLKIGGPNTNVDLKELDFLRAKYNVLIDTVSFTPVSIIGKSKYPKHQDVKSFGVVISTTNEFNDPVNFGIELMKLLMDNTENAEYKEFLFLLSGSRKILSDQDEVDWGSSFSNYLQKRENYLLYD